MHQPGALRVQMLNGIRVVDLSRVLAGPWATQQLVDQGATVVKVEPPGGDETRRFEPVVEGMSTYFLSINRGKHCLQLDLKTDNGRSAFYKLLGDADVLVHNLRAGPAARLGVDEESIRAIRPQLVIVGITGFGEDSERAGYDLVLQAMGGAMSFTGMPGSAPVRAGLPVADLLTGMATVQAALLGLLHRERTGEGSTWPVNMMQVQAAALTYHASRQAITGESEHRRGNAHRGLAPYDVYSCSDGHLAIACGNDRLWQRLRTALDIEDKLAWQTNAGRVADRSSIDEAIRAALGAYATEQAESILVSAGIPAGRVQDVEAVLQHPSVTLVEAEHPSGTVRLPGPIVQAKR
jgi:crotonobetainyl-CoA:carnitine CoA-transferase CaiB-like acyl-CoA transferase